MPNCRISWIEFGDKLFSSFISMTMVSELMITLHGPRYPPVTRSQFSYRPSAGGMFNMHELGSTIFFLSWRQFWLTISTRRCFLPSNLETYSMSPIANAWRTRVEETCPLSLEFIASATPLWDLFAVSMTERTMKALKPNSSQSFTNSAASPDAL